MESTDAQTAFISLYDRRGTVVGHAIVDAEDAERIVVHRWRLQKIRLGHRIHFYARFDSKHLDQPILMHRLVLGLSDDDPLEADHINHNGLDNRRSNLRAVTHAQNLQNKRSSLHASSIHRAVHWDKKSCKWRAREKLNGRDYHIGLFTCEQEAANAAAAWRREHMPYAVEAS